MIVEFKMTSRLIGQLDSALHPTHYGTNYIQCVSAVVYVSACVVSACMLTSIPC